MRRCWNFRRLLPLLLVTTFRSASSFTAPSLPPLYSFGLIADIQYADAEDAMNFQKTSMRRYRQSLSIYEDAIQHWSSVSSTKFAVILGDIVDGRAAGARDQQACLQRIIDTGNIGKGIEIEKFYCFGNHCHYCFSRTELREKLILPNLVHRKDINGLPSNFLYDNQLYYHWKPFDGWRFVALDGYDVSIIGASSEKNKDLATRLLRDNNHNDLNVSGGWFNDLPRDKHRWVPYNGGIGVEQLKWIEQLLIGTEKRNERVAFFCHQPIFSPDRPKCLVWNAEEILSLLTSYSHVSLWMAGHDHGGMHYLDDFGIRHLVPPAPIECDLGEKAYGLIDVYDDHLMMNWVGKKPREDIFRPWPEKIDLLPQQIQLH